MKTPDFSTLLLLVGAFIILFLILREVNLWYWKINQHIINQRTTNFYLERIANQLGCGDGNVVVLESVSTGKTQEMPLREWLASDALEENRKLYRVIGMKWSEKETTFESNIPSN
jgi:hypothetical protein